MHYIETLACQRMNMQNCLIDPYTYALVQKMTWVKCLLDDNFVSMWKQQNWLLKKFTQIQIFCGILIPLRAFYVFYVIPNQQTLSALGMFSGKKTAATEICNLIFSEIGCWQVLWYNKHIRSTSKKYFYNESSFRAAYCLKNWFLILMHRQEIGENSIFYEVHSLGMAQTGPILKTQMQYSQLLKNI